MKSTASPLQFSKILVAALVMSAPLGLAGVRGTLDARTIEYVQRVKDGAGTTISPAGRERVSRAIAACNAVGWSSNGGYLGTLGYLLKQNAGTGSTIYPVGGRTTSTATLGVNVTWTDGGLNYLSNTSARSTTGINHTSGTYSIVVVATSTKSSSNSNSVPLSSSGSNHLTPGCWANLKDFGTVPGAIWRVNTSGNQLSTDHFVNGVSTGTTFGTYAPATRNVFIANLTSGTASNSNWRIGGDEAGGANVFVGILESVFVFEGKILNQGKVDMFQNALGGGG